MDTNFEEDCQEAVSKQLNHFLSMPTHLIPLIRQDGGQSFNVEMRPTDVMSVEPASPYRDLTFKRSGDTVSYLEVDKEGGLTSKNSLSLQRAPLGLLNCAARDAANIPFWPGGFDEQNKPIESGQAFPFDDLPGKEINESELLKPLRTEEELLEGPSFDFIGVSKAEGDDLAAKIEPDGSVDGSTGVNKVETFPVLTSKSKNVENRGKVSVDSKSYKWAVLDNTSTVNKEFKKEVPNPAKMWPFELDTFQKQAIMHIEKQENVFVAAHTSAGKTVVAEYAIALCMAHHTKALYTSPLKALSNQKFRDFRETFDKEKIGLLTGDVQIRTNAPCLIMTTEILRSMLYNGSDVIRDVEWVIFDEVHYINDAERGVVWEETLIMLPDHVGVVMLSATVPNALDFADWVGCTKKKPIYVVSTLKRPVPLEHFLYTGNSQKTSDELFQIIDERGQFCLPAYRSALEAKKERTSKFAASFGAKGSHRAANPKEEQNIWLSLVRKLQKMENLPVVVFTFSRKRCDSTSASLTSLDLTNGAEKSFIHSFFVKSTRKLKLEDNKLPQICNMLELLKRGIAVHHSGILPLLKEIVELLFQKGKVKLLFATETFAMGVNMPARTVVFDSISKHDGQQKRNLLPGEYIQMAGRAGRRGLDPTGTVIIMCKGEVPESSELNRMILGKPIKLESKFRVTYGMILSLSRVDTIRVEDMLKRSYAEVDSVRQIPQRKVELTEMTRQLNELTKNTNYPAYVDEYYSSLSRLFEMTLELQARVLDYQSVWKAMSPGRILLITTSSNKWHVGVLLQSFIKPLKKFLVLLLCEKGSEGLEKSAYSQLPAPVLAADTQWLPDVAVERPDPLSHTLVEVHTENVAGLLREVFSIDEKSIIQDFKQRQLPRFRENPPHSSVTKVVERLVSFVDDIDIRSLLLNPVQDLKLNKYEDVQMYQVMESLKLRVSSFAGKADKDFSIQFESAKKKAQLEESIANLNYQLSESSLQLSPDFQQREKVLKRLGYLSKRNVILHKGKVACNLNNHEVFLTELLHENTLRSFTVEETIALLASLVFQQAQTSEPSLTNNLEQGKEKMQKLATKLATIEVECGISITVDEYLREFHWGLTEVVYKWALKMPFSEIMKLTDVQEGVIVRCIHRLDEMCKDIRKAARVIGDVTLHDTMEQASTLIRRDIVFAGSLYLDD